MAKKKKGHPVAKGVAAGLLGIGGLGAIMYNAKRLRRARLAREYRALHEMGHMPSYVRRELLAVGRTSKKARWLGIPGTQLKAGKLHRGTTKYLARTKGVIKRLLKLVKRVPK